MGLKINMGTIALLLLLASAVNAQVFDVRNYGGKSNGDITPVRMHAYI